ncbi:MAG: GntR family transcriptional regulator [Firmicutes bacterium]|jgi:DNA-binding GntR family transcriptional regulator|nr:GntR family transcriptional regulator [Bacillota bacterium]
MARRIQVESVTEMVKERLRQMIMEGDLTPGTKILQDQIAEELGVSKTPVLKALHVLESENLVESIPRRGFFIREFTMSEIADVFAVREVVEGVAAEEAANLMTDKEIQRLATIFAPFRPPLGEDETRAYAVADKKFHNLIVAACRNEFIQQIDTMVNVLSISFQPGLLRSPEETLPEHQEMVEAIKDRDPLRARKAAMDHLYRTRVWLYRRLKIEEAIR